LQIADFWYSKTALDDLLGVLAQKVNDDRLYRGLDELLPHKDDLFSHFQQVYGELFGADFDLLLYDVTSTYFEVQMQTNPQAKRGYSRDKRPDCVQVCIALVVTSEGLPLAYEVFDGNRCRRDDSGTDRRIYARKVRPRAAHVGDGPRYGQRRQSRDAA
jgi:transposase